MLSLLDLAFPEDCRACGAPVGALCDPCAEPLKAAARLAWPSPTPPGMPMPWSVAAYDGGAKAAILAYKEHGAVSMTLPLAHALCTSLLAAASRCAGQRTVVVPMPSTRASTRARGDDVLLRMVRTATRLARRRSGIRLPVVPALRLDPRTADSAGLSAVARRENLCGAMQLRPQALRGLKDCVVLLADDLVTTGATLTAAATCLRASGIEVVAAATVAATVRRVGADP